MNIYLLMDVFLCIQFLIAMTHIYLLRKSLFQAEKSIAILIATQIKTSANNIQLSNYLEALIKNNIKQSTTVEKNGS